METGITSSEAATKNKLIPRDSLQEKLPTLVFAGGYYPRELEEYSVVIDGRMPDDVRLMLQRAFRQTIISKFPQYKSPSRHTPFLQCILLLDLLQKQEKRSIGMRTRKFRTELKTRGLEANIVPRLIHKLQMLDLIETQKSHLFLHEQQYRLWLETPMHTRMNQYYQSELSNPPEMILKVVELKAEPDEWLCLDMLGTRIGSVVEGKALLEMGIVEFKEVDMQTYGRLSNLGWYLYFQREPHEWAQPMILVSADFEAFVPHNYDPEAIEYLLHISKLKNTGYFLVFDLNVVASKETKSLMELLNKRAMAVPDVVRFELTNVRKSQ
ncbi:hypothetical protein LLE49_23440 [Alicyclobacillus tolerans]|uniref:hypothetical protein n=1 Tax=Alicyclobacillus tolerans TaxID=90970 RepID=UPI001F3A4704|nr:hypothetical protein [Alicyclobacillus tolerans]MCF8567677.1 hypothetical protein [Alicyclobacillus tolerans]